LKFPGVTLGLLLSVVASACAAQSVRPRFTLLPRGDVFAPLLADPKQPEFLAGIVRLRSSIRSTTVGAAAFGENIGAVRWAGAGVCDGIQIGLAGGVFAQFDLAAASIDLLNADYLISLPVTYRRASWSFRVRVYHQSSHLGDEYLLQAQPRRVNLSFESVESIVARDLAAWRLYGGGEYVLRHEPADLAHGSLHGGGSSIIKHRG
jgi:hypothetical protein